MSLVENRHLRTLVRWPFVVGDAYVIGAMNDADVTKG